MGGYCCVREFWYVYGRGAAAGLLMSFEQRTTANRTGEARLPAHMVLVRARVSWQARVEVVSPILEDWTH